MRKLKLDISEKGKNWQDISDTEMLKRLLERKEIYRETLLFRGVEGERRIRDVLNRGSDHPTRDTLMAYNVEETFFDKGNVPLFDYADAHDNGRRAIAVYDGTQFIPVDVYTAQSEYIYRFKDPKNKKDSLVAIVDIKEE